MEKEASELLFCKKHNGVVLRTRVNDRVVGYECSEGGESLTLSDVYEGIGYVWTWDELEEETHIESYLQDYEDGVHTLST